MSWNQAHESRFGVHSIDHFALQVPSLAEAEHFFRHFGLDIEAVSPQQIALRCAGSPHVWGRLFEGGPKRMAYLSLNCFAEEFESLRQQILAHDGREAAPYQAHVTQHDFWFLDPDGNLLQLKPGAKTMPSAAASSTAAASAQSVNISPRHHPAGRRGASTRSAVQPVRPRRLAHVLLFTSDINRSIDFYRDALGLRLSDRSQDAVAFMHARHGCDHHLVAFASSSARGWHHSSWDVPSFDDVGEGGEQMRKAGYTRGWGTGRHVLGSNYFHYVQDPWGSFAEYSFDIDYVPAGTVWKDGNFPPEDSLYLWGPSVPEDFIFNTEA
jgi:catechol 2,3-dioxygenase-like lactoylglutathione lyase family enzyme